METTFNRIRGGVCAPAGFRASALACGIKKQHSDRLDLALIVSDSPTVGAAVFTRNRVRAAPVRLSQEHLQKSAPRAIVANSGNANACTGEAGMEHARRMAAAAARALGFEMVEIQVCSTGIIGLPLPIERIEPRFQELVEGLKKSCSDAAAAIMTSDTRPKSVAVEYRDEEGTPIRVGAIAKGAGMIQPGMATMLCFVTTDAEVSEAEIREATREAVDMTFNRISVDGDMSTNDTVVVMANGRAGNRKIHRTKGRRAFRAALVEVMGDLARKIVGDGERVTKVVDVRVKGARSDEDAEKVARAVANSSLVKCSWNGSDPNWGRIIHAVGYSGADIEENAIDIRFDDLPACRGGLVAETALSELAAVVRRREFAVEIDLNLGKGSFTMVTSDLSPEYVLFNREEYALTRNKWGK